MAAIRKVVLIIAILLVSCATGGETERTANVWEPGKTLPTYRVRQEPNGTVKLYPYGDPFEWRYKVTPDGSIYKRTDPFERIGNIKQKGGERWQY